MPKHKYLKGSRASLLELKTLRPIQHLQDCLFNFGNLEKLKCIQWHIFAKVGSNFGQKPKTLQKITKTIKICPSGEIFANV